MGCDWHSTTRTLEALESPLLLSVARQLESGPRGLYGPYGGRYPLVLIHAPLYYRLAALAGWPLYRAGFDPVTAALAAGRLLSALGFLATLAAAYRLARLGGMPAQGRVVGRSARRRHADLWRLAV